MDVGGIRFDQSFVGKAGCAMSSAAVRGVPGLDLAVGFVVAVEGDVAVDEMVILARFGGENKYVVMSNLVWISMQDLEIGRGT